MTLGFDKPTYYLVYELVFEVVEMILFIQKTA